MTPRHDIEKNSSQPAILLMGRQSLLEDYPQPNSRQSSLKQGVLTSLP